MCSLENHSSFTLDKLLANCVVQMFTIVQLIVTRESQTWLSSVWVKSLSVAIQMRLPRWQEFLITPFFSFVFVSVDEMMMVRMFLFVNIWQMKFVIFSKIAVGLSWSFIVMYKIISM